MSDGRAPLYRRAQAMLKDYIFDHRLGPGDPLPPEAELAKAFGMSRLSLREAVKSLESVGVLKSRHGGGVYVAEFSFAPILENLPYSFQIDARNFRELLVLRESLEEGLAARTLESIRPVDIASLQAIARRMTETTDHTAAAELDRQFHLVMFQILQNGLVTQLLDLFWMIYHRLKAELSPPAVSPNDLSAIHMAIVDALRGGNAAEVVKAIREHFSGIRGWCLEQSLQVDLVTATPAKGMGGVLG